MERDVLNDYGPTAADLQNAIDDAIAATDDVVRTLYLASRVWVIDQVINIPSTARPIRIVGEPHDIYGSGGTILRVDATLLTPLDSVIEIESPYHELDSLKIDANRKAKYGLKVSNWAIGRMRGVMITNALVDGAHLTTSGINDGILCQQCFFDNNGVTYVSDKLVGDYHVGAITEEVAGTASVTAASTTVTFSSAPDLTTLGIRRGDFLRVGQSITLSPLTSSSTVATGTTPSAHRWRKGQTVTIHSASVPAYNGVFTIKDVPTATTFTYDFAGGSSPATGAVAINRELSFYGVIESVTNSTTLALQAASSNRPSFTASGQEFAIAVGDGWHEERQANNNINVFDSCIFRASAGAGMRMSGLFGNTLTGGQADFNNFFGIAIGDADNQSAVFESTINHVFMEGNRAFDYYYGQATDLTIIAPTGNTVSRSNGILARGMILHNGVTESLELGAPQNFLLEVRNNGTTLSPDLEHRVVADHYDSFASVQAYKVNGATHVWTNTQSVSSSNDFVAGVGIDSSFPHVLMLDVLQQQDFAATGIATIEYDDTGTGPYQVMLNTDALNVAGRTIIRPSIYLSKNGALQNWNATTLPPGKTLGIRLQLLIR